MKWKQLPLGPLQTNCYILFNENQECIVIDPGAEGEKLITYLRHESLRPQAILLTHAHFDHIGAVDEVREAFQIPVYIHKLEASWLLDPSLNGSQLFLNGDAVQTSPADFMIEHEGFLNIGSFSFQILETPGHSPGSISFYINEINTVFAGDTLFFGSIGRTDLPGGSHEQLLQSIEKKLIVLPKDTNILPGHGPATTVQREVDSNPFL